MVNEKKPHADNKHISECLCAAMRLLEDYEQRRDKGEEWEMCNGIASQAWDLLYERGASRSYVEAVADKAKVERITVRMKKFVQQKYLTASYASVAEEFGLY